MDSSFCRKRELQDEKKIEKKKKQKTFDCPIGSLAAAVVSNHRKLLAFDSVGYTPNANMADLSVGPGLVARRRG